MSESRLWADRWADTREIFDGLAADYDRYRPRYAEQSLRQLASHAGGARRIADLASGTGILARQLRGLFPDSEILGAEPGADMLAEAVRGTDPPSRIRWLAARAEALPFADGSIDLVTAGQAVHWFDRERFYAECRRVLRVGGALAILYNNRIRGSAIAEAHESTLERVSPGYWRGYRDHDTGGELRNCEGVLAVRRLRCRWSWRLTVPAFIGYIRSTSHFKAALRSRAEAEVVGELHAAVAPHAGADGLVRMPCETVLTLARFA